MARVLDRRPLLLGDGEVIKNLGNGLLELCRGGVLWHVESLEDRPSQFGRLNPSLDMSDNKMMTGGVSTAANVSSALEGRGVGLKTSRREGCNTASRIGGTPQIRKRNPVSGPTPLISRSVMIKTRVGTAACCVGATLLGVDRTWARRPIRLRTNMTTIETSWTR
ncbi:MAG: hypothetical protein ACRDWA_03850 [Acidimicrobiia bacterium]